MEEMVNKFSDIITYFSFFWF